VRTLSTISFSGAKYDKFIIVVSSWSSTAGGTFRLTVTPPPPSNDACSAATLNYYGFQEGSTLSSTPSAGAPDVPCIPAYANDVCSLGWRKRRSSIRSASCRSSTTITRLSAGTPAPTRSPSCTAATARRLQHRDRDVRIDGDDALRRRGIDVLDPHRQQRRRRGRRVLFAVEPEAPVNDLGRIRRRSSTAPIRLRSRRPSRSSAPTDEVSTGACVPASHDVWFSYVPSTTGTIDVDVVSPDANPFNEVPYADVSTLYGPVIACSIDGPFGLAAGTR